MRQHKEWGIFITLFLCVFHPISAQTLEWSQFRQQVLEHHPLVKQSKILTDQAASAMLRARGGFDPKTFGAYSNKDFNGKNYFQYAEAGLKMPLRAGVELKAAYNYANGVFLNSESSLPEIGQASFGLEWSLGQGLLFDERRAGIQQATIGFDLNAAERQNVQNDLMLEAAKAYWNWVLAQQSLQITEDAFRQALIRHVGLTESYQQGDKPAIDTLESFILVQSRSLDLQFARTEAQNAAIQLCLYWWTNTGETVEPGVLPLAPRITALDGPNINMEALQEQARNRHPEIQLYKAKLRQLAVERRLKNEKRKPVINLSYYLLGDGWEFFPTSSSQGVGMIVNDVKWGLDLSYPLLNRKARGDYQLVQLKQRQLELDLQFKIQSISAKIQQYANEYNNLRNQVTLFRDMANNFQRLLDAESQKFLQGESSVFLINAREQRWLDTQLKLLKLSIELRKVEAGLQWASGLLATE